MLDTILPCQYVVCDPLKAHEKCLLLLVPCIAHLEKVVPFARPETKQLDLFMDEETN
jgi:hypothetical protein